MSTTETPVSPARFETEPMMTQHSHSLGEMRFYAPDAPASEWGKLPWCLETEKGWDGRVETRLVYVVHPDHIQHAWKHPAMIDARHLWPHL